MTNIKRVLVVGGTGMLGRPVVRQLLADNYDVVVGGRDSGKISRLFGNRVGNVALDVTNQESLEKVLPGFDALHLNMPSGPRFEDCFTIGVKGCEAVARVAFKSNIKRISLISGASNLSLNHPFPPARAKAIMEAAIKDSGVPYSIFRPTWFMETLDLLVRFGVIVIMGSGNSKAHWIAAGDYAKMVSRSYGIQSAENKTFIVYGPELVQYSDAVRIYRDLLYPRRPVIRTPLWQPELFGKLFGMHDAWFGAQMMRFLEQEAEVGDPSETNNLLGKAEITVEQFARLRKNPKQT